LAGLGGKKYKLIAAFGDKEDTQLLQSIVSILEPGKKLSWHEPTKQTVRIEVLGTAILTGAYLRAIAKISFHYFLKMDDQFTGHERCFAAIKQLIIRGEKHNPIVTVKQGTLVEEISAVIRPSRFFHILVAERREDRIVGKVQLFLGPYVQPLVYEIKIAEAPSSVLMAPKLGGHSFVYFDEKTASGYDGIMESLVIARRAKPYRVVRRWAK